MTIYTYWRLSEHDEMPELLVACDEFVMDSNPDWWKRECTKMEDAFPRSEWRTIELSVPVDAVLGAFKTQVVSAQVKSVSP